METFIKSNAAATNISHSYCSEYITGQIVFVCSKDFFISWRNRDRICGENTHSDTHSHLYHHPAQVLGRSTVSRRLKVLATSRQARNERENRSSWRLSNKEEEQVEGGKESGFLKHEETTGRVLSQL